MTHESKGHDHTPRIKINPQIILILSNFNDDITSSYVEAENPKPACATVAGFLLQPTSS
jgi:hypothetical protein